MKPKQQSLSRVLGSSLSRRLLRTHSPNWFKRTPEASSSCWIKSVSLSFNVILAGTVCFQFTFVVMFILTHLIERELMCLLLRWPYGQSTIGSQYDKTTYKSEYPNILTWIMWEGHG